jgi:hypothetical protein
MYGKPNLKKGNIKYATNPAILAMDKAVRD